MNSPISIAAHALTNWLNVDRNYFGIDFPAGPDGCDEQLVIPAAASVSGVSALPDAVDGYADKHGYDAGWLRREFGLKIEGGQLVFPYRDADGAEVAAVRRHGVAVQWSGRPDDARVYGAWRVQSFAGDRLIVCVGGSEEQVHAAAARGIDVVGVHDLIADAKALVDAILTNKGITEVLLLLPARPVHPFGFTALINFVRLNAAGHGALVVCQPSTVG